LAPPTRGGIAHIRNLPIDSASVSRAYQGIQERNRSYLTVRSIGTYVCTVSGKARRRPWSNKTGRAKQLGGGLMRRSQQFSVPLDRQSV
jgi:hypothetical protein